MHPFLNFFSLFQLPAMGFCILCGTIAAFVLIWFLHKKSPIAPAHILDGLIWAIFSGFVGMKVLYWIVTPTQFPTTWAALFEVISTGMVFYGGLIGGVLGVLICCRVRKVKFVDYGDLFLPAFCLAHAGGRIGCLLAGCCYGVEYHGFCAVELEGVSRLPIPLMESLFLLLLAGALVWLFLHVKRRGLVTAVYMLGYALWRFVIEYFRGDAERGFVGALSTSQFISVFILLVGLWFLYRSLRKDKSKGGKPDA